MDPRPRAEAIRVPSSDRDRFPKGPRDLARPASLAPLFENLLEPARPRAYWLSERVRETARIKDCVARSPRRGWIIIARDSLDRWDVLEVAQLERELADCH